MKILIDEGEVLSRIMKAVYDAEGAFYEGPKLQKAAQSGELEVYFTDMDGDLHLVLNLGEDCPE